VPSMPAASAPPAAATAAGAAAAASASAVDAAQPHPLPTPLSPPLPSLVWAAGRRGGDIASNRTLLICPTPTRRAAQRACAARAAQSSHARARANGGSSPGQRLEAHTSHLLAGAHRGRRERAGEVPYRAPNAHFARHLLRGKRGWVNAVERQRRGAHVWHTVLSHWVTAPWARGFLANAAASFCPAQAPLDCVALCRRRLGAGLHAPEHPLGEVRLAPAPVGGRRNACGVATHEVVEPQVQDRATVAGTVSTREELV